MVTKKSDETTDVIEVAVNTMTGDIRDFLLDRVKNLGKPWPAMTEDEQRDQITAAKDAAERLVREIAKLIAAEGKKAMVGTVDSITVKDGIKAVIKLSKADECRHELMDAQGQTVMLVVADAEPFTGERGPAEPDPDQGNLISKAEKLKKDGGKVTSLR